MFLWCLRLQVNHECEKIPCKTWFCLQRKVPLIGEIFQYTQQSGWDQWIWSPSGKNSRQPSAGLSIQSSNQLGPHSQRQQAQQMIPSLNNTSKLQGFGFGAKKIQANFWNTPSTLFTHIYIMYLYYMYVFIMYTKLHCAYRCITYMYIHTSYINIQVL